MNEDMIIKKTEKKSLRKQLIKRFAIIFFVVLLLLTFFSNTIMNRTLPEVETVTINGGSVSKKVRCQGTVEISQDVEVTVSGNRKVKDVLVENGDTVKKGDIIMSFEESENTELEEAEDSLETMEINYAKSLLKVAPDYEDDNEAIAEAREDLKKAIDAQDKAFDDNRKLDKLKADYKSAQAKADKQQAKVDKLKAQVDGYAETGDYDTVSQTVESDKTTLKDEQNTLAQLKKELTRLTEDYNDAKAKYESSIGAYNDYLVKLAEYQQKVADYEAGISTIEPIPPEVVEEPALPSEKEYQRSVEDKQVEISTSEAKIAAADAQLKKDQATLATLSPSVDVNKDYKKASADLEKLNAEVTKAEKAVTDMGEVITNEAAADDVKAKRKALETAIEALSDKKEQDSITAQTDAYDRQTSEKEIEKQKEKIKKLKENDDFTELKASEDGTISGLSVKAGDSITADSSVATIQLATSGYEVSCSVSKSESRLLKVGNEASIENIWDSDVTSEIKSIKSDPASPNQQSIVKFKVVGNVQPGETLQFAVGEKGGKYDTVVPNSAVKEDSEGKYVLVVKIKPTPLGNRYIVKKTKIEIEAQDTANTAILGEVAQYENVITNASKPLDNGQQVRLTDN